MNIKKTKFYISKWKCPKIRIPVLRLPYRILLYLLTIVFAALSLVNVIMETFHFMIGITFYVCAAITLSASCYYMAINIRYSVKEKIIPVIEANPFTNRVTKDYRYRTVIFAVQGLVLNILFAIFNSVIGIVSRSPWVGTLAAYYIVLSTMRISALKHYRKVSKMGMTKELMLDEISVYKRCGVLFIIMTIILGGAVVLMVVSEEGKNYPGFTIYAVAAYVFYKIIISIVNVVKSRKMKAPLLMAIRDIGHVDAYVSILTLQTGMFASFGKENTLMIRAMNGLTGIVVCCIIMIMGIYVIRLSGKMKKEILG